MKPLELITIIAKWEGVYLPYLLDRKEGTRQVAEFCAYCLLAYCHDATTFEKSEVLGFSEVDLIYLKNTCLQKIRTEERYRKKVEELTSYLEYCHGLTNWDKVDYEKKATVKLDLRYEANAVFSSKGKPLYFASDSVKKEFNRKRRRTKKNI